MTRPERTRPPEFGFRLDAVYVEFGADRPAFLWCGGAPTAAKAAFHGQMVDVTTHAQHDLDVPGGRLVQRGVQWLAEVDVQEAGAERRHLRMTMLVTAAGAPDGWAAAAARQAGEVLADADVSTQPDVIERVLRAGGRPPFEPPPWRAWRSRRQIASFVGRWPSPSGEHWGVLALGLAAGLVVLGMLIWVLYH